MHWSVVIDSHARKYIKRLPKSDARRITSALRDFFVNPHGGDIEKMKNEKNVWRRRVGSYRIFYEIYTSRKIVYVYNIRRRTSKTY